MALLQVRNFPDDLYSELMVLAQNEQRSVSRQITVLLKSALTGQEQQRMIRNNLLQTLLLSEPELTDDYPSPADLIREDRER